MSNRWQMQGSYVWSRLDGVQQSLSTGTTTLRADGYYDFTNPNNLLDFVGLGRGANDQPHAFKMLGSYQAPWGINIGANYQALSGLPRDRTLTRAARAGLAQHSGRGARHLSLRPPQPALAARRQGVPLHGSRRASFIGEVHNVLNSNAGQSNSAT